MIKLLLKNANMVWSKPFANLSELFWLQNKPDPEVSSVQTILFSVLFPKYFNLQLKPYQQLFSSVLKNFEP